ncbi:chaperone J-domain-containing protein [Pluteus cervinus]|uniref:Chaperone J-domain-containing protein n=1 Tax=Pluteus cervinus TaxID=181527 RepID=A0ACD3AQ13_9AGAR|nr:chaperone J-domain-containing protein [Pluteus cervinus]
MASVKFVPITVPPLPLDYNAPSTSSALVQRTLIPVGPAHFNHLRLAVHHNHSFDTFDKHIEEEQKRQAEIDAAKDAGLEDDLGVGDEAEPDDLLSLDPKEWKKQDQYAVLGLSHLRHLATPEQIKVAHRKKVLKHHPDKKASKPGHNSSTTAMLIGLHQNTNDDAFFKCISKAYDVLTNPEKRRQFDSVDPEFLEVEDDIPTAQEFKNLNFIKTFTPIFERWARFSKKQPVPSLGKLDAPKDEVEGFYNFWYNFDSWRSFEWLDKEVNEGSDSRDDKRYTEKKNKSERARRKKEDTAKLRGLVDLALGLDPRIKRIKQEEKEARERKKKGSVSGTATPKKTKEEEEAEKQRKLEEEKKKEEEEKVAKADAKKAKAAAANAAKKARRAARAVEDDS